ncbi:hypothetical protein ACHAXH_008885 [Discostella pseudostelligera]
MKSLMPLALLLGRLSLSSAFTSSRFSLRSSPLGINYFVAPTSSTYLNMSSTAASAKRVLVPIADDSEEIETTCITDTLTRFGAEVVVASVKPDGDLVCKMSRGVKIMADISIDQAAGQSWDLVALPGGMPGAAHLRDSPTLISILKKQNASGKLYAAICASPAIVLAGNGLVGEGATCYPAPGLLEKMSSPVDDDVVVQGNVVTGKGPGTALKFALKLGEQLYGAEKAKAIAGEMLA